MTAVSALNAPSVAAHAEEDAPLRPVPWRQMLWVTWRQHRVALSGVAVLLVALSVLLWVEGVRLHDSYTAALACRPIGSAACTYAVDTFGGIANFLRNGFVFQAIPALIGAFVGAPLLARELESGSFRFVWTQAMGRWRWTVAKLALLALSVTVASGAFSVLLTWYFSPYFGQANAGVGLFGITPFDPGLFSLHGVTFAAWTLAAFAVGVLAGVLIRRVVPAIVATLATYVGLTVLTNAYLRPHYLTAVTAPAADMPGNAWILSQWLTKDGRFAFAWPPPISVFEQACPNGPSGSGGKSGAGFAGCLAQHGYTVFAGYHPSSQYWSFQWIEAGWLLGLSALAIAATIWIVRRRAA
jgi:hypothetical protein